MNRATEIFSHILKPNFLFFHKNLLEEVESQNESHSVMSDSLKTRARYSPLNSPGQNIGVGSHSLLQGIFPTQGPNPSLPHYRHVLNQLSHQENPEVEVSHMAIIHLKILSNCQTDFLLLLF